MNAQLLIRVTVVFAFFSSASLWAETASEQKPVDKPTPASEAVTDSTRNTFGKRMLTGIASLFRLNNDEDEAALRQSQQASKELFQDIQSLKSDVVSLNADLRLMEEELLFPVNTQSTFFVSQQTDALFKLEGARLVIDGKTVSSYFYTDKERQALLHGGMHRLYVGNLGNGPHQATVVFTGLGPNERVYERAASLDFNKQSGAGYFELKISASKAKNQPEFDIISW